MQRIREFCENEQHYNDEHSCLEIQLHDLMTMAKEAANEGVDQHLSQRHDHRKERN